MVSRCWPPRRGGGTRGCARDPEEQEGQEKGGQSPLSVGDGTRWRAAHRRRRASSDWRRRERRRCRCWRGEAEGVFISKPPLSETRGAVRSLHRGAVAVSQLPFARRTLRSAGIVILFTSSFFPLVCSPCCPWVYAQLCCHTLVFIVFWITFFTDSCSLRAWRLRILLEASRPAEGYCRCARPVRDLLFENPVPLAATGSVLLPLPRPCYSRKTPVFGFPFQVRLPPPSRYTYS